VQRLPTLEIMDARRPASLCRANGKRWMHFDEEAGYGQSDTTLAVAVHDPAQPWAVVQTD
jgi:hypothetical protein